MGFAPGSGGEFAHAQGIHSVGVDELERSSVDACLGQGYVPFPGPVVIGFDFSIRCMVPLPYGVRLRATAASGMSAWTSSGT